MFFDTIVMLYQWNVMGHEKELSRLEEDFTNKTLHHAYLFVGPEKIGKFRIAKALAALTQCQENFCRRCAACIQIEKKSHIDTVELEDDGESIKIDGIRDIIARLNMTRQSPHKILLIQNCGRLTEEAANCLLKTLEEPPPNTLFLFTANQLRDIMPTIASRMRILHFKKLPDQVLLQALKERYPEVDEEMLNQVIVLSLGRSGRALQLLSDPELFEELRELYRSIELLKKTSSLARRIGALQEMSKDQNKTKTFLSLLAYHTRRTLLAEQSFPAKQKAIALIEEIHRVINLLHRNVNPRLLLEHITLFL